MEGTKCYENNGNANQRAQQHKQDMYQQQYYGQNNEKLNYPIGDSKDVNFGQGHNHVCEREREREDEVSNDDNESYNTKLNDNTYRRASSTIENEIGDYRDSQQQQHQQQPSHSQHHQHSQHLQHLQHLQHQHQHQHQHHHVRPTFDTEYANELTYDFLKEQRENRLRAQANKNKARHQEIVKKLYDCEQQRSLANEPRKPKPTSYFGEQPKSHGELTTIFAQNHNMSKKLMQTSLTPTENDALSRIMHDPADPIRLKNTYQRRNFSRPIYDPQMQYDPDQHRVNPSFKTGKIIETMKRHQLRKPDFYSNMNAMNINSVNMNSMNMSLNAAAAANKPPASTYYPSYDANPQSMILNLPKLMKKTDPEVEVKYENNKFGHHSVGHNTDNYAYENDAMCNNQTSESNIKDETSEDKMSTSKFCTSSKNKMSARTNRSKRSTATHNSQKITDIYNANRSKCELMSVITDGLQKMDASRYDTTLQKCSQTQTNNAELSSHDKTTSSILNYNADLTPNMLKEYIEYHLSNIKEEVRRLERLENITTKN